MYKCFLAIAVLFFSCSGEIKKNETTKISDSASVAGNGQENTTTTPPTPSATLRRLIAAAANKFQLTNTDTFSFCNKNDMHLFSLANADVFLPENERQRAHSAIAIQIMLNEKASGNKIVVQEWIFNSPESATAFESALTAPLHDKSQERFVRTPFTFWRNNNKIYHLFAEHSEGRKALDIVNQMLVDLLTPADMY